METNSAGDVSKKKSHSLLRWLALIVCAATWIVCFITVLKGANALGNFSFENACLMVGIFLFPLITGQAITLLRTRLDWLTAILIVLALLTVGFGCSEKPFGDTDALGQVFQNAEISFSIAFFGLLGFLLATKIVRSIFAKLGNGLSAHPSKRAFAQFNIRKLLIWTALIGIVFASVGMQNQLLFRFDFNEQLDSKTNLEFFLIAGAIIGLSYLVLTTFVIIPATYWLSESRPRWLVVLSVSILPFAISIIGTLAYSASLPKDTWEDEEVYGWIMLFALLISVLFVISTICFNALKDETERGSTRTARQLGKWNWLLRIPEWCVYGSTLAFGAYLVGWLILHFGFAWLPSRDVDLLRNSSIARARLEASFPVDVVARAKQAESSDDLIVFLNALLSDGVTKETNAAYQIASLSRIEYLDRENDFTARERLGFTREEVELLEDHQLLTWLESKRGSHLNGGFDDSWDELDDLNESAGLIQDLLKTASNQEYSYHVRVVPWTAEEFPLAFEYCESKQEVFQKIREATKCEHFFIPVFDSGYWLLSSNSLNFARDSLMIDARFQIGRKNLELAIADIEALRRLGDLQPSFDCYAVADARRCYSAAYDIGFQVLTNPNCSRANADGVIELLRDLPELFSDHESQLPIGQAMLVRQTADWYFEVPTHGYGYSITERLPKKFPRMVDWRKAEILAAEKFDLKRSKVSSTANFTANYSFENRRFSDVDDDRFYHSFARLLRGPSAKARSPFWELDFVKSDGMELIMAFSFVTRDYLDRIGLALAMYRFENGEYPKSLELLSPEFMKEVPMDPFTDKPFCYQRSKDTFLLYSTGRNQIDHGGTDPSIDWIWEKPSENVEEYLLKN